MHASQQTNSTSPPAGIPRDGVAADILNVLPGAVLLVDRRRQITYRNASAAAWLPVGEDVEAVLAAVRFFEPFQWSRVLADIFDHGGCVHLDCACKRFPGGATVLATLRGMPLRRTGAAPVDGVVIVMEERSTQEPTAEQLEISNRLTALGKVASRVAHELNNPLDGILRYINLALRLVDPAPDPKLKTYLSESRAGLLRMIQIVGDLLEFSRAGDGMFEAIGVNEVIEQAMKTVAAQAESAGVVISGDFQTRKMPVISGSRLYQVCLNLLKNAVEAMPGGGRLIVSSARIGNEVVIRVEDTGGGLPCPPELVFEPFFTTKPAGRGTGLGLAICKDFVEDLHGTITAANGPERGAVFTVRIPASSFGPAQRVPQTPTARGTRA